MTIGQQRDHHDSAIYQDTVKEAKPPKIKGYCLRHDRWEFADYPCGCFQDKNGVSVNTSDMVCGNCDRWRRDESLPIKLADYVLEYLSNIGIAQVFVVYGSACGHLIDAFTRIPGIEYIAVKHEQAGSFAVEGYAKASDGLGVSIVTSGPGGTNLLTGIANCYYDSVPALFITGQIKSQFLKTHPSVRQVGFQENDIVAMSRPITKMAEMITKPEDIKYILDKAIYTAMSGRRGPVLFDIPMDIQAAIIVPDELRSYAPKKLSFNYGNIKLAIAEFFYDFKHAKRPVLLVGGGAWEARDGIRELGKRLKVPCIPTWNAIDVFTSDYEFYRGRIGTFGGVGRNFAIQNSDLILSIGCRFSGRITGGNVKSFAREAKKYIVDIDEALLYYQQVKGDVNIQCDAKEFIQLLLDALPEYSINDTSWWLGKTLEWKNKYQPVLNEYYKESKTVNPYLFIKVLSEELASDAVIVSDCGGNVVNAYQALETKYGQRVFSNHGNSPMGFSFCGAMGAWFYNPSRQVVCIIGDGGFNMNLQELQTIRCINTYGTQADFTTFILNNGGYGITKMFQDTHFGSRYVACGNNNPNFVKVVEAYGLRAETIENHNEMRDKIRSILNRRDSKAVVCDVDTRGYCTYTPRIVGWNTPIEDMEPYLERDEFRNNMYFEPLKGWKEHNY